jgi:hypothetical protein
MRTHSFSPDLIGPIGLLQSLLIPVRCTYQPSTINKVQRTLERASHPTMQQLWSVPHEVLTSDAFHDIIWVTAHSH